MKKVLRIFLWIVCVIVLLLVGVFIAIQTPYVQTYITQKVMVNLNDQFGTSIEVGKVDIDFWGDINLYNVKATDHRELEFIQIPHLRADLSLWDIYKNSSDITIDELDLTNANVQVKTYEGDKISNFIQFINNFVVKDSTTDSNFKIRGNVIIEDSKLSIINYNLNPKRQVWLDATSLNGELRNIDVSGSTYLGDIENLRFDAVKNGEAYTLQELSSAFKMTDKGIYLNDLKLETQSSKLDGYVRLKYDSISQFNDFGNKVIWDLELGDDDQIGYKDLRYFTSGFNKNQIIHISGKANGPLNALNLENLSLFSGDTSIAVDQINLSNLMEGGFDINSGNLDLKTSYDELIQILPEQFAGSLTNYIQRFGKVTYKGSLRVNDQLVLVDGYATTALGNAEINLNLTEYQGNNPRYSGEVNTSGLNLRKLTNTKELGMVAGKIKFDGRGFDVSSLGVNAVGSLNYLDIMDNRYQDITVDGMLDQQRFNGLLAINDPNAKLNFDGIFDFSEEHLKADFVSDVSFINLKYFDILKKKNSWFKGTIIGDATFSDINDIDGSIKIKDITFNTDTIQLSLPEANLSIEAVEEMQRRVLVDIPTHLNAEVVGKFELVEIPTVLKNGIGNFLVDYKKESVSPNQMFTFNISIEDNILSYVIPELYVQPQTTIRGRTNDAERIFEAQLLSPFIQYDTYKADSVNIYFTTEVNNSFAVMIDKFEVQNNVFKDIDIQGQKSQDTITASANFYSGTERYGKFDLNFYQTFNINNQIKTGFASSTIQLDDQVWVINPNNDHDSNYAILDFEKEEFIASNILIQSDEQQIRINGDYLNDNDFTLDADLENVSLAKIIPKSYLGDLSLEGIANGSIDIIKTEKKLKPEADLRIDSIVLNDNLLGNFVTNATYDIEEKIFNITGSLDKDNINTLFLTGAIDNKGEQPELDLVANLDDYDINVLSVFLDEVLTNWSGTISGDVSVQGNATNPSINGFVTAENIGFKVVYLGTTYIMEGENDLILQKEPGTSGYITLPEVSFVETASQTSGSVDGLLIFSSLSDWFLDLDFDADRLLVMNTSVADNELFYGKVYAGGTFNMYGPASDLELSGYGVDVLKGSSISLNTGATSTVSDNRFIQFYAYDAQGELISNEEEELEVSGFSIDLDLNVDEGTTVNLVLDAQSDDKIEARGTANDFIIQMNRAGKLNIEGEYVISDGIYNYREAVVIDKNFELEKGGYIRFDGDPYNAVMNLQAVYSRYVNNLGDYLGINTTQATEVELVIDISGDLENANVEFFIEAPKAGSQVKTALAAKLNGNADERIKQASFLLVMGKFGSEDLFDADNATGAATASAFELLGKQIGNIFSSIIPGFELNPTYLQANNTSTQTDRIQTEYNLALNDRLRINGAVGTPLGTETNEQVTMQLELDYDISKEGDGGLILRGFTRPTTFGMENFRANSTYAQSYGAGIVYRKSFNSFRELFQKKDDQEDNRTPKKPIEQKNDSIMRRDSIIMENKSALIQFD